MKKPISRFYLLLVLVPLLLLASMGDVMPGLSGAAEVFADPDRRRAIEKGLELLHPGDALLIAGKGHESTQQIGDVKHPFSDQQTVREILGCA